MNDYELAQLDFQGVVAQFGGAYERVALNDIVLLDVSAISFLADTRPPLKMRRSVIACRITSHDNRSGKIVISKIWKYYDDGSSAPEAGAEQIDQNYFQKPVQQRLDESDSLFE
jgi:hypothetical protein